MFGFFKNRRRARLRSAPFPPAWSEILQSKVRLTRLLPDIDRRELEGLIQIFLTEKSFEGCGGLEINDEIKLTIAAQACLLLLHRQTDIYPRLVPILVYPDAYRSKHRELIGPGTVLEGEIDRLGESWPTGAVVLSWRDIKDSANQYRDGRNLVLHEFAHQLDLEDGEVNGAPLIERSDQSAMWAQVFSAEYERLQRDAWRGRSTVIDDYGTQSPAEFFAVCTEAFFEKPHVLQKRHPQLYEQLRLFYRQDPASWAPETGLRIVGIDESHEP
jgi:Mlc titration factor MtfA (ptsG expression regulator)